MTAACLIADMQRRGVRLESDGVKLVIDAPPGVVTQADLDALRAHRDEVIALVAAEGESRPKPDTWSSTPDPGPGPDPVTDAVRHGEYWCARYRAAGITPTPEMVAMSAGVDRPTSNGSDPQPRWRCRNRFCRDSSRWWMSTYKVVNCMNCTPPAFPSLVVTEGTVTDAPLVERNRSRQALTESPGAVQSDTIDEPKMGG